MEEDNITKYRTQQTSCQQHWGKFANDYIIVDICYTTSEVNVHTKTACITSKSQLTEEETP